MKSEEDFDAFLKNKLSDESGFPFEEDKWARMEEMILADETKRRRRKFLFIFLGGFVTALLLVIPLSWYIYTHTPEEKHSKNEKLQSSVKQQTEIKQGEQQNTGEKAPEHTGTKQENTQQKNTNEEKNEQSEGQQNAKETNNVQSTAASEQHTEKKESESQKTVKTKTARPQKSKKQNKGTRDNSAVSYPELTTQYSNDSQREKEEKETQANTQKEQQIAATQQQTKEKTQEKEHNQQETKTESNTEKQTEPAEKTEVKDTLQQQAQAQDTLANTANAADSLQQTVQKQDSVKAPEAPEQFSLFAVSGLQYNFGYAQNDGASFSPFLAFEARFRLSPAWSLISGLGYYQVSGLDHEKTIISRTYSFGYEETSFTIKQKHFHYVYIPVELNFGNKNNVSIGANLSYLFANNNQIIEQVSNSLGVTNDSKRNSYRYAYGISPFDLQFSVGYSHKFGKRFLLGASYTIGTADVRKNEWTGNTTHEKNQFVRFNLKYKLK